MKIALLLGATLLVSVLSRRLGGGPKRNLVMLAGTLGGLAIGALAAYPVSQWIRVKGFDAVDVCLFVGILVGWALAWPVARRFPGREAN